MSTIFLCSPRLLAVKVVLVCNHLRTTTLLCICTKVGDNGILRLSSFTYIIEFEFASYFALDIHKWKSTEFIFDNTVGLLNQFSALVKLRTVKISGWLDPSLIRQ